MYISQVEIDLNNRKKMKELSHLGVYHSWVEDSFPDEEGKRSRKLWRIDKINGRKYLIIVSENSPDINKLEKFGVKSTARFKSYDKYLSTINQGDKMRFRVTLNPIVSRKEEISKRGRVYPLLNYYDQANFLLERSEKNGFKLKLEDFAIVERKFVPLKKEGKKLVNLSKVTYEGLLTVTDKDLFYRSLTQGFGKKKAYGCGLMTVIKVAD
ncbi:MAG: type I-E CRISPR-associated protein Cas6/Cse3/CasE [Peptoniphilaceae bacterium]|nr:type I-E CRISPR-associated protein Cas6/Cse3/CasE [Peptoniphilaceae bacterium]MDY6019198.1 type I-E CRISPR-associated protein Cas6/Cse3/CasE [Anaerococcus sp.]